MLHSWMSGVMQTLKREMRFLIISLQARCRVWQLTLAYIFWWGCLRCLGGVEVLIIYNIIVPCYFPLSCPPTSPCFWAGWLHITALLSRHWHLLLYLDTTNMTPFWAILFQSCSLNMLGYIFRLSRPSQSVEKTQQVCLRISGRESCKKLLLG